MACDLTTLLTDAACYIGRPAPILQAASLELWCTISGGVTPPASDTRITAASEPRITAEADTRVIVT